MTFDGEYLWYADKTTDRIYQIQLMDDFLVKKTDAAAGSSGICTGDEFTPVLRAATEAKKSLFEITITQEGYILRYGEKFFRVDGRGIDVINGYSLSITGSHGQFDR